MSEKDPTFVMTILYEAGQAAWFSMSVPSHFKIHVDKRRKFWLDVGLSSQWFFIELGNWWF